MTPLLSDLERLRDALRGQYAIDRLLGQGGMGAVYLARDLTLDRLVAIKVIASDIAANEQSRRRFLQEARLVAALRHPGLVTVYSAGAADDQLFFVMEYVPGESLRDVMKREGPLPTSRVERILNELALALDYANSHGVVHRDVKPENILIDRESGRAMLTDFGVARVMERDVAITGTGAILGSPRYMSPEQVTGDQTLDGRSDLYALALVGHEMCVGRPVFEATSAAIMLVKHLTEEPPSVASLRADVPDGLATAIDRGLRKSRDDRWTTGGEMAAAIGIGTPSAELLAPRRGLTPTGGAPSIRRWIAMGSVAAAMVVGALLWQRRAGGAASRQAFVIVPFELQTGNRDVAWLREGAVNMLALSIGQWRDAAVTAYERTLDLVRAAGVMDGARVSFAAAQTVARQARAGSLVMGQVSTTSDSLLVVARLYDANTGALAHEVTQATGIAADPRPMFDALARQLLDVAGEHAASTVDVTKATTSSLAAYREYLDGLRALNAWQLDSATARFTRAIAYDSTFALAWHKRAIALGWSDIAGTEYVISAERAMALADRLPVRERRWVEGHLNLARGLSRNDSVALVHLAQARQLYTTALITDSSSADVWYGLGDAAYHSAQKGGGDDFAPLMQQAIRAFERSLALDPHMHLAYSHLLGLYNQFANPREQLALLGDSIARASDVRPPARLDSARAASGRRAANGARAWLRTDPNAAPAWEQLSRTFLTVRRADSASYYLQEGWRRAGADGAALALMAPLFRFVAGDTAVRGALTFAIDSTRIKDLRRRPSGERSQYLSSAMALSGAVGDSRLLERAATLWSSTDSVVVGTSVPLGPFVSWFAVGQRVAMGETVTPAIRKRLLDGVQAIDRVPTNNRFDLQRGASAVMYLAFVATRDTTFAQHARRLQPDNPMTELQAAVALVRHDTATARQIARTFPSADSVRSVALGFAGMRTALRAEVLAQLGDVRGALAQYEAIDPFRFNISLADPGVAVYVRSFAERGRLYELIGERAKAREAYRAFLARWSVDDPITAPSRAAARAALARLGDAG